MSYRCKHIPDEVLEKLDQDYQELFNLHVSREVQFQLSDMAIQSVEMAVEGNISVTHSSRDPDFVALMRGTIEAMGQINFMIVGRGSIKTGDKNESEH